MTAIIDYNIGNLASVYNACDFLGEKAYIVKDPEKLKLFDRIILPGVGAFGSAMQSLIQTGMKDSIMQYASSGKNMLGICLGMQLLFDSSSEFGKHIGLGLINGDIVEFDKSKMQDNTRIPHVGWNTINTHDNHTLFDGLQNPYLYFVHSYHVKTTKGNIIGSTNYGYEFTSAVQKDNIYGFQPHPEKSHDNGLQILKNFINLK